MRVRPSGSEPDSVVVVVEQLRRSAPGGIGTYCRSLLAGMRQIADDGVPVAPIALVASRRGGTGDPLAGLGWPLHTFGLPAPLLTRMWDHGLASVTGPGVVHALSLAAPPHRRGPLVVTVHDLTFRSFPEAFPARGRRWHERAFARAASGATCLVVPSTPVADDVIRSGVDAGRVVVIEHGGDHLDQPDLAATDELLAQLGVVGPFVLAVGTLEPRKNLVRLVAAHERARSRLSSPYPLVVVGPSGWGPGRPPAGSSVVLAGPVPGPVLAGLYCRARLLAYVPLSEGFGLPPLEAMGLGTPVLASSVPSTGGAAWEVDPTDVDAIASGIVAVATDESLRCELQEAGRRRAGARTWRASAEEHLALWRGLR